MSRVCRKMNSTACCVMSSTSTTTATFLSVRNQFGTCLAPFSSQPLLWRQLVTATSPLKRQVAVCLPCYSLFSEFLYAWPCSLKSESDSVRSDSDWTNVSTRAGFRAWARTSGLCWFPCWELWFSSSFLLSLWRGWKTGISALLFITASSRLRQLVSVTSLQVRGRRSSVVMLK